MKKVFRIIAIALVVIIFAGTFVFLYQKSKPEVPEYATYKAAPATLERTTVVTGSIEPRDEVLIKPQISGIISELYKQAGDVVKKGEVIAKVKVIPEMSALSSAENRVRLAKMNADQARIDFDRTKKLHADKLVSDEEYEKSSLALQQAQEEVTTANDALKITRDGVSDLSAGYSTTLIRSTVDGLILDVPVKVGNSVIMSNTFNDGTTIATVADMNDLIFKGTIDETEVARLHEGMPMKISVGALPDREFAATLEYIAPKVSAGSTANQFEIKAAVSMGLEVKMRAGYSANAKIVLERAENVLAVPEAAVEFQGDSTFVYVLTSAPEVRPQEFSKKAVSTGLSDGVNVEIKSGLRQGQQVRGNQK